MHLYTQPAALDRILPLAALSGCRAVLLAEESGGHPFDEALSGPWLALAHRFPDRPIPAACASCTLELARSVRCVQDAWRDGCGGVVRLSHSSRRGQRFCGLPRPALRAHSACRLRSAEGPGCRDW